MATMLPSWGVRLECFKEPASRQMHKYPPCWRFGVHLRSAFRERASWQGQRLPQCPRVLGLKPQPLSKFLYGSGSRNSMNVACKSHIT